MTPEDKGAVNVTIDTHPGHLLIRGQKPEDLEYAIYQMQGHTLTLKASRVEWDVEENCWKIGVEFVPLPLKAVLDMGFEFEIVDEVDG